jgi:hypothetical protein
MSSWPKAGGEERQNDSVEMAFEQLLDEARQVAFKSVEQLRALQQLFPEEFTPEEIKWLTRLMVDPTQERRRVLRCHQFPQRVMVRPVDQRDPPLETYICDRSPHGLGIWLRSPVTAGTVLEVWPRDAPAEACLAEVRYCVARGAGWLVGCELVHRS